MSTLMPLPVNSVELDSFCRRWKIVRMQLLGSSFPQPGGDIELVTTLEPSAQWSLLDHVQAEDELGEILGQKVDILGRHTIDAMQNALNRSAYLSRIGVTVYG